MTDKERLGEMNFQIAKGILGILGVDKGGAIRGLIDACADCKKYGPPEGKPCMSLRLARETGVEYTPPEWCRDPDERKG